MTAHHWPLRIYYEDTDAGGVVYHATYLRLCERARTEALRAAGLPHAAMVEQHGVMFLVRRAELDYLAPALLDDALDVVTETRALTGATVLLRQTVMRPADGRRLVVADITLVAARVADQRATRIPPAWRAGLAAMIPPHPGHDDDTSGPQGPAQQMGMRP